MRGPEAFADILKCPRCGGGVEAKKSELSCSACEQAFPAVGGIPWFYDDPSAMVSHWQGAAAMELSRQNGVTENLKAELKETHSSLTEKRLQKTLQARFEHIKALEKVLAPLRAENTPESEVTRALRSRVPSTQSLGAYEGNLFRDWAWGDEGDGENEQSLATVLSQIPEGAPKDTVVVFGSGAGRLAYDLHRALGSTRTVALDINPLLSFVAKKMYDGRKLTLYEFPLAPKDSSCVAVSRRLKAPEAPVEGLHPLLGDGMNPPFLDESVDLVVTPWFIDIVPQDLKELMPRLNRVLKPEGHWLNFGTLVFNSSRYARRYAPEEIREMIPEAGFELKGETSARIPYLDSPASCQTRMESLWAFSAKKTSSVGEPAAFRYLPEWLTNPQTPIPKLASFETFAKSHAFYAQVVGLVDGNRSARDIADMLSQQFGLEADEALGTFLNFLTTVYEESLLPKDK